MTVGIVDTTVIIHYLRKNQAAQKWVKGQPVRLSITPITWLEVMQGAPGKVGQATAKAVLNLFDMVYLMPIDWDWTMQQMELYRLSRGIWINDCLVASVSQRLQVPLYTDNVKDMRKVLPPSLVIKPY